MYEQNSNWTWSEFEPKAKSEFLLNFLYKWLLVLSNRCPMMLWPRFVGCAHIFCKAHTCGLVPCATSCEKVLVFTMFILWCIPSVAISPIWSKFNCNTLLYNSRFHAIWLFFLIMAIRKEWIRAHWSWQIMLIFQDFAIILEKLPYEILFLDANQNKIQ